MAKKKRKSKQEQQEQQDGEVQVPPTVARQEAGADPRPRMNRTEYEREMRVSTVSWWRCRSGSRRRDPRSASCSRAGTLNSANCCPRGIRLNACLQPDALDGWNSRINAADVYGLSINLGGSEGSGSDTIETIVIGSRGCCFGRHILIPYLRFLCVAVVVIGGTSSKDETPGTAADHAARASRREQTKGNPAGHRSAALTGTLKGTRVTGTDRRKLAADLKHRYDAGESIRALAVATGRSYGFIHRMLTEAGVSLRGRTGAEQVRETRR